MKKCPYCGTKLNDDSLFCTECGKKFPNDYFCPYCGASVNDGDVFCPNCGQPLDKTSKNNIANEENKIIYIKKYWPYVISCIVLLGIIWKYTSGAMENNTPIESTSDSDVIVIDSLNEKANINSVEYIEKAVRDMYEELFEGNLDYQEFEEKYTSSEFHRIYSEAKIVDNEELMLFDYDHWTSSQDSDNPSLHSLSIKKLSDNKAIADIKLKLFKDFDSLNEVKLLLVVEKGNWVVDDFITPFDGNEYSLKSNLSKSLKELKSSNSNGTSLYVGRWSNYIISQDQRVKVYSVIINEDNTAKWILYMPDGSINTSMVFRQCVFQNGYVYFTDNGDISIKGTPRFRLGPNGLQTADGEDMTKE